VLSALLKVDCVKEGLPIRWQSLVECTGLENRRAAKPRGLESLPLRLFVPHASRGSRAGAAST